MKILVVDELCYPQMGGIQVRFKALAEEWVKLGHDVNITAIDHIGTLSAHDVINGVNYNRILKDSNYYKSGKFGRKISTIIKYSFALRPYLKANWDLIVFCQFPMVPQIFYKFFYHKRAKTILDFVEHRDSRLWKIINNGIINSADKVVCISNHVKECAYTYRKDNLYIMPSFVDTTTAISKSKSNYIFLGRLEKHKHPELAIQAVIRYNESYNKNMSLIVMGGGSLLNSLRDQFSNIPFVKFAGNVDEEEKQQILANGRVLILPSEREGLPIVVIEALSYGVPTITSNYPGNGTQFFVTDEKIGLITSPEIEDIAAKIDEIEKNYDHFVERCNQVKGNYDIGLISRKYLEIFN